MDHGNTMAALVAESDNNRMIFSQYALLPPL